MGTVVRLSLLLFMVIGYIVIGAFIFMAVEQPNETRLRVDVFDIVADFLQNNTCVEREELRSLVSELLNIYDQGINPLRNSTDDEPSNWDFANSFFFATTVVTTIGYGNLSPNTYAGQQICIFYATIGIPLTYIMLAAITDAYKSVYSSFAETMQRPLGRIKNQKLRKFLLVFMFCSALYVLLVIIPSVFFSLVEDWSMHIAHYYTFVSLSTIGFGDLVASYGTKLNGGWRIVYKLLLAIYFLFGITLVSGIFAYCQEKQQSHGKRMGHLAKKVLKHGKEDKNQNIESKDAGGDGALASADDEVNKTQDSLVSLENGKEVVVVGETEPEEHSTYL